LGECKGELVFRTYEEFWDFCFSKCTEFKIGCASSCRFRRNLGIPPFGSCIWGSSKVSLENRGDNCWVAENLKEVKIFRFQSQKSNLDSVLSAHA
jgi:hypothetical protein